jgi:acetyl-CoA acetyltransferase family protein
MREAFLVGGVRTPVGRYGGVLAGSRPDDLAALVIGEVVARVGLDPALVDEVILGNTNGAGEENRNVARMAVLLAGWPDTVPGYTVNRLCASGLQAAANAAMQIRSGEADIVVAGGVESMTRGPWVTPKPSKAWAKPEASFDTSLGWRLVNPAMPPEHTISMGETAEEVAALDGVSREDCDAFAFRSQQRAAEASKAGLFEGEIVPVETRTGTVKVDETIRETSLEKLAGLKTVFRSPGVVTAGNASPLSDGASALVVASAEACEAHGLTPRARIVTTASAGLPPKIMGLGPVPSIEKALGRLSLGIDDVDAVEINEAFAAQSIACQRRLHIDDEVLNTVGGAIALGHPLGSSGSRLLVTLLGRMERGNLQRGLASLCIGVGQGLAMVVEKV